ncbi:MAG: hypothetical protein ACR2H0_06415 [Candidatus Limnocylindrales bacterium]
MRFDDVLFIGLAFVWLAVCVVTQRWAQRRLAAGAISMDTALFVHAGTFAVLPLLALPSRHSASDIALFVALSAALFLGQLALTKLMLRFVKGR